MTSERIPLDATRGRGNAASDPDALGPAAWIWTGNAPDAHGQMAQFRLRFEADANATWTGFADTLYTLFCNGRVVG